MRYMLCVLCILSVTPIMAQTKPADKTKPVEAERPFVEDYPLDLNKIGLKLPDTTSDELRRILSSRTTIFYKLPQVWQHYVPASRIEYNNVTLNTKTYYNTKQVYGVYFSTYAPDFHANSNFPWETTVGLNTTFKEHKQKGTVSPYRTVNFINLPEKNGVMMPILILSEYPIKWIYPPGTTVGEIIYVVHKDKRYVQEIRTRTKSDDSYEWTPGLYRPIKDRKEYERLTGLYNYTTFHKHFYFRNPQEDEVFKMEGIVERLPDLPEDKVVELLSRPFQAIDVDKGVWSPASDSEFNILPKDYCLDLLKSVDSFTCAGCHRQTQISVRNLTPKDPDVVKTPLKIGNIRGSDAVFTWHPFDPKTVRASEKDADLQIALRKYDYDNKIIAVTSSEETDKKYGAYKLTRFVQDSLKPYELPAAHFLHSDTAVEPKVGQ